MIKNFCVFFYVGLVSVSVVFSVKADDGGAAAVYKVAIDKEYAPYEFIDQDGEIKGFTPDLLREIGKSTGAIFSFIPMDWPDAVAALEDGRIDLINMIRTTQRLDQYEFSEPHSYIKQAIFRHVSAHEVGGPESLAGHRVALQRNDISLEMLGSRTDFTKQLVQSKAEGFLLLNAGRVDAFLAAEQAGLRLIREYGLSDVEPSAVGLFPQDFCFAARKGNLKLINFLNAALQQLKKSGRYDAISDKWLSIGVAWHSWAVHYWRAAVGLIGALMIVLAGFVIWSIMLRRSVELRTKALRESRNSLNEAQRIGRIGSWEWDIEADALQWSDETFRIFGMNPKKFKADFGAFIDAVHPDDRERVNQSVDQAVRDGASEWTVDYRIIQPSGELSFLHEEARSIFAPDGRVVKRVGTVQDVTEMKRMEDSLRRMNRKLKAISDCNQVLMRAEDEQTLLSEICRIICEEAGYSLAWVGYAEEDGNKAIRPIAWAGIDFDYEAAAGLSWSEEAEFGKGPAGTAIRSGETVYIHDFALDPQTVSYPESVLAPGCGSCTALPLKDENGTAFGALLVYSAEPLIEDREETELMEELAGDLAFGVVVLRNREKRRQAEEALQEERRLLLEAQRMAHIGNWHHDMTTGEFYWSEEFFRILGIKPQKPTAQLAAEMIHPDDLPKLLAAMEESAAGKMEHDHDFRIIRPDGEIRWVRNRWIRVNDKDGKEIKRVGTHQDITEQKNAEELLRKLNEELDQRVRERTAELEAKNEELERMNQLFVGRELRMVELKERIKELESDAK